MAGPGRPRRRRGSSASIDSTDDRRRRWTKELTILKPVEPGTSDDQWPSFAVLTDATIYQKDGKTLANPLHVDLEGPFIVRGKLEPVEDDDDEAHECFQKPYSRATWIEISRSERYSIGYDPNTLWVSGASGWFEIIPSKKYEGMYSEVMEAITLYYEIMGPYEEHKRVVKKTDRKKRKDVKPPSLDEIFFKYALTAGDGGVTVIEEVEARCHKWAQFLLAHFPKESEIKWEETEFAAWLQAAHPDLQKKIADVAAGLLTKPAVEPEGLLARDDHHHSPDSQTLAIREPPKGRTTKTSRQASELSDQRSEKGKGVARDSPSGAGTPIPASVSSRHLPSNSPLPRASPAVFVGNDDLPDDPVDRLIVLLGEVAQRLDINTVKMSRVNSDLFYNCRIKVYTAARELCEHFAKELVERLPPIWDNTPFKAWLEDVVRSGRPEPTDLRVEDIPSYLNRRNRRQPGIPRGSKALDVSPSIEADLEPRAGKRPRVGRPSGKVATLRVAGTKRLASDMVDDDDDMAPRRGRKALKRTAETAEDEVSDADSAIIDIPDDNGVVPQDAVRIVVQAERLPTMSPAGPNGTWTCDQEGCCYVVRSADEPSGQELISKHFKDHEEQAQKINLAMEESRAGHLPINHLLDRIQNMGKKAVAKQRGSLNGEPLPLPIKRRLLI
ncbi:hypothetical protein B0T20DRAFT_472731 [Sordaria brevicollis]|uniref:Defective in methylation-7 protein n=1 Tax=Sordaria brevicollis TaxID=83679 RepID=A0AAE0P280_SORBR|nr:hypothetical protein B0T20DRAFT_472731 [Sordaria brevicollis]